MKVAEFMPKEKSRSKKVYRRWWTYRAMRRNMARLQYRKARKVA